MAATNSTRPSGSELDALELGAWRGFLRTHARITRALDAELIAEHGLSLSAYEVLLFLAEAPAGRMRMSELADGVLLSRSGLTRLVDRLEGEELVRREECHTDARGLDAVITAAGRKRFTRARRTHLSGVRERFLEQLSAAEQRRLAELWVRLAG